VPEFDDIAASYDLTRGGESRGDEYAEAIAALLPPGEEPVLEIGVGTGVVALGLSRRGRTVVGLDVSSPMLVRARSRIGPVVVRSDAMSMAIATSSVAHAVSVWVVHSVTDPALLFREAARVIRPTGHYIVCSTQRPDPDDEIGMIISEMCRRIDECRGASRPRGVTTDEVLEWASTAGFSGTLHRVERQWVSSPADELLAIEHRTWPAMRELDEEGIEEVTRPAVESLKRLPADDLVLKATAEIIDFELSI
jgi:ubiquinone/menaquinone biosynthesis C-methylase UbiE